ncbi:MAG: glycerophosphodiester phosphodiesterase [Bryobacteraceae bacterium]
MLLLAAFASNCDAASRILVHGHRGARAVLPENTIPAFEHAIEAGADLIELDVLVTKDDVPVVVHDPTLNPLICKGPVSGSPSIRSLTLAELRQWDCGSLRNPNFPRQTPVPGTRIPTLDEVFALAERGNFQFNVELKLFAKQPEYTPSPEKFAELVLAAIRRRGLEKRVVVQSFDFRPLHVMKRLAPEIPLAALDSSGKEDFVATAGRAGAKTIAPELRLVTPEKVKQAHEAGLQVVPWTASTKEEWDRLIGAGVDAIITDDPAGLIAHLKSRKLR